MGHQTLYPGERMMYKVDRSLPSRSLQMSGGEREHITAPLRMLALGRKQTTSGFQVESRYHMVQELYF